MAKAIEIVSWNAGGFNSMPYSFNWLMGKLRKPALVLFQNTRIAAENVDLIKPKIRIDFYRSFLGVSTIKELNGGVSSYSRKAVPVALQMAPSVRSHFLCSHNYSPVVPFPRHTIFSIAGRVVVTDHEKFVLINTYFPPHYNQGAKILARRRLQKEILDYTTKLLDSKRNVVIAGDMNFPPEIHDIEKDFIQGDMFEKDREWYSEMRKLGVTDCYRAMHPRSKFYSTRSIAAFPGIAKQDVGARTSLILANKEFIENHVLDCHYLDFRYLKYPDPRARILHDKNETDENNTEQENDAPLEEKGKELKKQKNTRVENVVRILKVKHCPVVLSTNLERLRSPLPSSREFKDL